MTTDEPIGYRVLGPLEVLRDGAPLDLGTPKQRTVLACLLLARGRIVSVERLLAVTWGEDLPASAHANLQVYVSRLRSALRDEATGVSAVARRAPGYVLSSAPGAIDADVFTARADRLHEALGARRWAEVLDGARTALEPWRGSLLEDLGDEAWFRAEADALEGRRVDVGAALLTSLLALGRPQEAAATARGLSDASPYRDELCRLEMLALHQSGRTVEALEAFTRHTGRLDDELGIDPGEDLRDTQVALLRQDAWAATWPLERGEAVLVVEPPTTAAPSAAAIPEPDSDLVGRAAELGVATGLVDDAFAGRPRVLALTGPAGIGKTRLAEEVLDDVARRGGRVVRGRCLEEAGAPAWWPLREVVRDLGADPDVVLDAPSDAGADTRRFAVYERVRELLETAAEARPLAVLVDDLQWADPASAGCLAYLGGALRTAPVLLVTTVRDETSAQARQATAGVLRAPGARQLVVPPLAPDDVTRLAERISGEPLTDPEADALVATTRGNALFVSEYAKLPRRERLAGQAPLAVRAVLARRVEGLDDEVVRLLQVAAVVGDVLDLGLLATVSGTPREEVVDLLDHAADAAIIEARLGGSGYGFAHALLRDEVLTGLSPLRRQRLHARVASVLTTAGGERVTQRAQHLVAAGPLVEPRDLLEACRAAALQAEERMSSETAVGWWEQASAALALLPDDEQDPQERDDLIVARVEALARAGRGETVLDVVLDGLLEAGRLGRTSTVGRLAGALLRATGTWPWVAFGQDPGPLLARLHGLLPLVDGDPGAQVRVLASLAVGSCYELDPAVPDRLSTRALELAERLGDPDVLADAIVARVITYVGESTHAEECERLLDRLVALPHTSSASDAAFAHSARTMSQVLIGDVAGMEREGRLGIVAADRRRLPVIRAQLRWMEVGIAHWRHGPVAAFETHAAAVEAHRRTELYDAGFGVMVLRTLHLDAGTLGELEEPDGFDALTWQAAWSAARGDHVRAAALLRERLAQPAPWIWASLAHALVRADTVAEIGDVELAHAMLAVLQPHAGRLCSLGQGPIVGPVDYFTARLRLLVGEPDAAHADVTAARELVSRLPGRRWVQRCDLLLAGLGAPDQRGKV